MNMRPLTIDDLTSWWDRRELPRTVRGFAAERDGELMGVAGVMYMPGRLLAFAEMVEEGQRYPLSIMRMARLMRGLLREISSPVFAQADAQYPNSGNFLEHLGFRHVQGDMYVFKNEGRS
jgi:hypothetical protein